MKAAAVLPTLLDRLASSGGQAVYFSAQELGEWLPALVGRLKAAGLLVPATPAASVICPGCEQECAMPVELANDPTGAVRAFVACDKREDTARVPVPLALVEQWQCAPRQLADAMASLLGLHRPSAETDPARLDLGVLKGAKHAAHVVLMVGPRLEFAISGHLLPVADVLELGDKGLAVDRRALLRCVENPVAGSGDGESAGKRRDRLLARVNEVRSQGIRAFLKTVAAEEGISVVRLKQIIYKKNLEYLGMWAGLGASSKKSKSRS